MIMCIRRNIVTSASTYHIKDTLMHYIFDINFNTVNWNNVSAKTTFDNNVQNMALCQPRQLSLFTSISANCALINMQKWTVHGRTSVPSLQKQINRCILPSLHQSLTTSGLYPNTNIYCRLLIMPYKLLNEIYIYISAFLTYSCKDWFINLWMEVICLQNYKIFQ